MISISCRTSSPGTGLQSRAHVSPCWDATAGKATWTPHGRIGYTNSHPRAKVREGNVDKTFHHLLPKQIFLRGKGAGRAAPRTETCPDLSTCFVVLPLSIRAGIWTRCGVKSITLEVSGNEKWPPLKRIFFLLCSLFRFAFYGTFFSPLFLLNPLPSSHLELSIDTGHPSISCYPHWKFLFSY